MSRTLRSIIMVAVASVIFGFDRPAEAFTAAFSWAGIPACQAISPAFELHQVPSGTKRLRFMMRDLQAPSFQHGGSTLPYVGDAMPRGAIHYIGPCPPTGERHVYRWTVEALDAAGKILARTVAEGTFPP